MPIPIPLDQIEIAHCGSPTSHLKPDMTPARIITCDGITQSEFGALAAIGDLVEGHFHGPDWIDPNPIIGPTSAITFVTGRACARVGDRTQCGAVILPDERGNPVTFTV